MLTPADHKVMHFLGKASEMQDLEKLIDEGLTPTEASESYVDGKLDQIVEYLCCLHGDTFAYNKLQAKADSIGANLGKTVRAERSP